MVGSLPSRCARAASGHAAAAPPRTRGASLDHLVGAGNCPWQGTIISFMSPPSCSGRAAAGKQPKRRESPERRQATRMMSRSATAPDGIFGTDRSVSAKRDSGHQGLLPFGHSSTEIRARVSVGEKSQTELDCSRSVVLISKFRAFVLLRARAVNQEAMRRPEHRRIFTIGQDE